MALGATAVKAIRFAIEAAAFRVLLALARFVPRRALLAAGSAAGTLGYLLDARHRRIALENGNAFLGYAGADGVKTGFTTSARETLVASATRGGHQVFVVLLNAPARFAEASALLDWVFSNFCWPADGDDVQACRPPNA